MAKRSFEIFTIVNYGTNHAFQPRKKVIDQYTNTERTLLDIHTDKVLEANDPLVYIQDNEGKRFKIERTL